MTHLLSKTCGTPQIIPEDEWFWYSDLKLLIDADVLMYTLGHRCSEWADDGTEEGWLLMWDEKDIKQEVINEVAWMCDTLGTKDVLMCFSDSTNYRHRVYPSYKANRDTSKRPPAYEIVKDTLRSNFPYIALKEAEADDVLSILSVPEKTIIVTIDKDLSQVRGLLYNTLHNTLYKMQPYEADRLFFGQVLHGDTVDNYHGLPGVGVAAAREILEEAEDCFKSYKSDTPLSLHEWYWRHIVDAYEDCGFTEEGAYNMAICAKMLTQNNIDSPLEMNILNDKSITLWKPPKLYSWEEIKEIYKMA